MKTQLMKLIFSTVAMLTLVVGSATGAKVVFVKEVTDNKSDPNYVAPED